MDVEMGMLLDLTYLRGPEDRGPHRALWRSESALSITAVHCISRFLRPAMKQAALLELDRPTVEVSYSRLLAENSKAVSWHLQMMEHAPQ